MNLALRTRTVYNQCCESRSVRFLNLDPGSGIGFFRMWISGPVYKRHLRSYDNFWPINFKFCVNMSKIVTCEEQNRII